MNNHWTITLEEDPETKELILPFTDEILNTVGWKAGDTIVWKNNNDGTWTLTKKVDNTTKESV
jgi:hypothetical protein